MYFLRLIIAFFILPLMLQAQDAVKTQDEIKVHASTTVKSFYLGEAFSLTILVSGSEQVKAPETSLIQDFVVKKISESALTHKDKKGYAIRYKLLAKRAGVLQVPPLQVKVNGEYKETQSISVEVKKPATHPGLKLTIHLSQTEAYVGEPLLATFTLSSELPLYAFNAVDITYPFIGHYGFRVYSPENAPVSGVKNSIGLPVSSTRVIALRSKTKVGEKNIDSITFTRIVIPTVAGELKLKPATFLASYTAPKVENNKRNWQPQYPSHFNNNFFEEVEGKSYDKYFASSQGLTLNVKALPMKGRPKDFGGLVGKCTIVAEATPTAIEEGAPVNLKITVGGHEYPSLPELSEFKDQLAFNRNFSIPSRQSLGRVVGKDKVFLRTLRPLRTDVAEIPPIRLTYFDPQTAKYGIAQTKSIALTVTPAKSVTAFDADLSGGKILRNTVVKNQQGIRHSSLSLEALENNSKLSKLLFVALLLPPIIFILVYFLTVDIRLQKKDPAAARRKRAYKNFQKNLLLVNDVRKLESSVKAYFGDRFNLVEDAHVLSEFSSALGEHEKAVVELYELFDSQRFSESGKTAELTEMKNRAQKIIENVNRSLKNV